MNDITTCEAVREQYHWAKMKMIDVLNGRSKSDVIKSLIVDNIV